MKNIYKFYNIIKVWNDKTLNIFDWKEIGLTFNLKYKKIKLKYSKNKIFNIYKYM